MNALGAARNSASHPDVLHTTIWKQITYSWVYPLAQHKICGVHVSLLTDINRYYPAIPGIH
eukprot:974996-Amorphochlora_amoeboformis.AAC.1